MAKAKTNGSRNRNAGKRWELRIIKRLRDSALYPHAVSTRSESRNLDACGIDVVNKNEVQTGMMMDSIQAKSSATIVPYPKLLDRIRQSNRPGAVIFHEQTRKSEGGKFMVRDEFAITHLDNYMELLKCREALKKIMQFHGTPAMNEVVKMYGLTQPVIVNT